MPNVPRNLKEEFILPQNEKEFDDLVKKLIKTFKITTSPDHVAAVVANRIMHLPPDKAKSSLQYLGECVLKNIAYQLADLKGRKISHEIQIQQLEQMLKNNPYDQQAIDALEKAVKDGSPIAQKVLDQYVKPIENVTSINQSQTLEPAG